MPAPILWEYFGAIVKIKGFDVFGGKQGTVFLIWCRQHGSQKSTGACSCYDVKVIRDPCILAIQLLHHRKRTPDQNEKETSILSNKSLRCCVGKCNRNNFLPLFVSM